jgi:hypothetical protein
MTVDPAPHGEFGASDYWRVWNRGVPFSHAVAGANETYHRTLAATTSWGVATSVYSLLADAGQDPGLSGVLRGMVTASRNCHEAYATHLSLAAVNDRDAFLDAYPRYRRRFAEADNLIRHLPRVAAAEWILEAAITACMNVPVIDRILAKGIGRFSLADVRSSEYPDQRMRALARVDAAEWAAAWASLDREFKGWSGWETLCLPPTSVGGPIGDSLDLDLVTFHQRAYREVATILSARGLPVLEWDGYRELLPALLTAFAEFSASPREVVRLINILRPMDHSSSFLGQARLVLRDEPVPARITAFADIDADGWRSMRQGTPPRSYLYMLARRNWDLKASYAFSDDDLALLPSEPNTSVTLLRADPLPGEAGPRLVRLDSTAELIEAIRLSDPEYVLSNPSVMLFDDDQWTGEWLGAMHEAGAFAVRIDLDPIVLLDAWCKPANQIRYSYLDMRDETGQLTRVFVCQWSSLPSGHAFVAVCSPDVAAGLGLYLEGRYGPWSVQDDGLVGEVVDWLKVILTKMLDDQHEFRFHGVIRRDIVTGQGHA